MPFEYVRDETARRIRITLTDPTTVAEFIESVERQFADGAWSYGLLIDGRRMTNPMPSTEIKAFVKRVGELVALHGPRGPIAFVARESHVIGAVQIYVFLGGKTESLEVFWDMDDAQRWLDGRMGARGQGTSSK